MTQITVAESKRDIKRPDLATSHRLFFAESKREFKRHDLATSHILFFAECKRDFKRHDLATSHKLLLLKVNVTSRGLTCHITQITVAESKSDFKKPDLTTLHRLFLLKVNVTLRGLTLPHHTDSSVNQAKNYVATVTEAKLGHPRSIQILRA